MLQYMPEATETCDCPRPHDNADGRCANPSVRSEEPAISALANYTQCGCCMADCPDVHAEPGSATAAAEDVASLGDETERCRSR